MSGKVKQINGVTVPYDVDVSTLIEILESNRWPECFVACYALGHKSEKEAFKALENKLSSQDWTFRRVAAEALMFHQFGRQAASKLIELLSDVNQIVVRAACQTLAGLGINESHDSIVSLLNSGDPSTRQVAINNLCSIWDELDFERVLNVFQLDPSVEVKKEAAWTLKKTVNKDTWKKLFDLWWHNPLARHRVWACQLVTIFGHADEYYTSILKHLENDHNGHVRKAALKALQQITGAR